MKQHKLDEEHELSRDIYFGDSYFTREQLVVLSEQIHLAYKHGGSEFMEIGVGNGFTSSFLKRAGKRVTTMDVNANLEPDIVGSILEEPMHFEPDSFETILCFEVLEHLPWEQFQTVINAIATLCSKRAIISLPRAKRTVLGFQGKLKLPRMNVKDVSVAVERKQKQIFEGHHWEIGWNEECSEAAVFEVMKSAFASVDHFIFPQNRYFHFFICSKPKPEC